MTHSAAHAGGWTVHHSLLAVAYGMVAAGILPIAASGELGWLPPAAFVAAMLVSLLRDPRVSPVRPVTAQLWTAVLVLSFAATIVRSLQDSLWLVHAMEFALLVTVSRFFQRRFAKDYLQLLGLSFILLLTGAIVQPGPMFAVCFLAYTVLTMWGLTLLHLVRELELQTHTGPEHLLPPPPPKRRWLGLLPPKVAPPPVQWPELPVHAGTIEWRSRRLIGPRYFAATSVLSLLVLAGSALFFFLFPRLGVGFFFAQTRPAKSVVGFSTDAQLGQFGAIKSNAEVVARVTFPDDPARLLAGVRLRGVAFDHYANNGWTRLKEEPWPLRYRDGKLVLPRADPPEPGVSRAVRAEIYLEPLDNANRVLFAPPGTWAVELLDTRFDYLRGRKKSVMRTPSGDLTYLAPPDTALHYAVHVAEPVGIAAEAKRLRAAEGDAPAQLLTRYTHLPETLDPRVAQLAQKLAGRAPTWFDKAAAIEAALREGWTYSLAGDQDAQKPLEDFLFGKKSGHCEYFASSMVLMMRTQGIPTRLVHGFSGGQFNPIGNYRMIRQADAHSWVEVFFPRIGWRTFDPTPASGQEAPPDTGLVQQLRHLADGASLLWYQWVVEYDLDRQVEMLRGLGKRVGQLRSPKMGSLFGGSSDQPAQAKNKAPVPWWAIAALVALAGVAGVRLAWVAWRDRPKVRVDRQVDRAVDQLQAALHKRGDGRAPHETWSAVASRLRPRAPEAAGAVAEFAVAWNQVRFAPAELRLDRGQLLAAVGRAREAVLRLPTKGR
ncbi:MAG: DUF3488 domain-containing protein [Deltaproteobacteria bacterium]|nr:DUF3488 domain-containing protein [Deltaproteobacteria bacterium]